MNVNAIITPRVTCNLPTQHIPFNSEWGHLANLTLADPDFGQPSKIDLLLGVEVFSSMVRQGRRCGVSGSPTAFETDFGWVLAGKASSHVSHLSLCTLHTTITEGDLLIRKWRNKRMKFPISLRKNVSLHASRGLFPSKLIHHNLWWKGPDWLKLSPTHWPERSQVPVLIIPKEEKVSCVTLVQPTEPLIPFNQFSSFQACDCLGHAICTKLSS